MTVEVMPDNTLGKLTYLMRMPFDASSVESLDSLEAQAFATWLHGAYLTIFLHVDQAPINPGLLFKRMNTLLQHGETILRNSRISSVAETADRLFIDLFLFATTPKLSSRDLFALAVRLPLGPITRQLLAWVDWAYGDAPRGYNDITYFALRADGTLYQNDMPTISQVSETEFTPAWRALPAFWRIMTLLSQTLPATPSSVTALLYNVISVSALPLTTRGGDLLFPNYIALLHNAYLLFYTEITTKHNATLIARLMQPWEGRQIRGAREAEAWLRGIVGHQTADITLPNSVIKYNVLARSMVNPLAATLFSSLEAIDPTAQPDNADDVNTTKTPTEPELDQNNSIGEISLEPDDDPGDAYLYRRTVLALDATLARDQNIEVSQNIRQALHLWCRDWLWLASVTQTETLIKDLGLQKILGPVAKKD